MGSILSKTKPSSWKATDLLIIGWLRNHKKHNLHVDIIRIVEWFYYKPIVPYSTYSIKCHHKYDSSYSKYLSYVTSSGRCRQSYATYQESQFRFISVNENENTFKIQNVYPDKRFSQYIFVNNMYKQLRLTTNPKEASIFQLIMIHNKYDNIQYQIKWIDSKKTEYVLGTESDKYEYNQFHSIISTNNQKQNKKREISSILFNKDNNTITYDYISIYSITSRNYVSFQDYTKYLREDYSNKEQSKFEFIPIENDKNELLYYMRNVLEPDSDYDRYNFWVGFEVDDDDPDVTRRKIRLYKNENKKAVFNIIKTDYGKGFIHVYYEDDPDNGGWLTDYGRWNVLTDDKDKANAYQLMIVNNDQLIFNYSLLLMDNRIDNISQNDLYALFSHNNSKYFSYETSSVKCREIYQNANESQLRFIRVNDIDNDLYFIQNGYKDSRLNYWMGFQTDNDKLLVRFFVDESKKAIWKFVMVKDKKFNKQIDGMMLFKIYGYYADDQNKNKNKNKKKCGWITADKNGNWNYLTLNESDAFLYSPRLLSTAHV